ncbi:unnamed protein product [Microthlaspi erraticum]|uniref:Uncharacterized protein n=1 Tax=Microthlaspi erraticum TaxID=1685480 RepID=A0A6D2LP03_9BRAS|nr:unnamed protein product [Microthlaspi erraticum]
MSVTSNGCASIEAPWRKELSIRTEGSGKEGRLKPDITKLQRARDRSIRRKPTKANSSEAHRRLNDGARIETEKPEKKGLENIKTKKKALNPDSGAEEAIGAGQETTTTKGAISEKPEREGKSFGG